MRNGLFRKIFATGIVMLFFGAIWITVFSGNISMVAAQVTIYVDDDNTTGPWDGTITNPYQYIQDGINAASEGDTVYVFNGTYNENVVLNKSITLQGDPLKPVIDGMSGVGINVTSSGVGAYGVTVEGFDIRNSSDGLYFELRDIEDLIDTSVIIGDIVFADNTINATSSGIYIYVDDVGYNMSGTSLVEIGDFRVNNNTIYSDYEGIYLNDFYDIGNYMYDTSSFTMGNVEFNNNTITSGDEGIYLDDIGYFGYNMYNNSSFTIGDFVVNNNIITSGDEGIYVYEFDEIGYFMYDN